jgi:Spy/CpxP family protein refolding chaperone
MFRSMTTGLGDSHCAVSEPTRWLAATLAVLMVCAAAPARAAAADAAAAVEAPTRPQAHTQVAGTLDHRVRVLTKALDLDEKQQAELRTILEEQREAVMKVWRDTKLLPAERAPATHAVAERTADRIRAILNEAQRAKYNPPKPPPAPTPDSGAPNVEAWIKAARPK